MKKIHLTESNLRSIVKECVHRALNETNKIRPWNDEDYAKANPLQRNDVDFDALKKYDDEYNDKHGINVS